MECCWQEQKTSYSFLRCDINCCKNVDAKKRLYRDCRVKFGVPLDQVCKRDIPGPLLVSLTVLKYLLIK